MEGENVGVALDDDRPAGFGDRRFGAVDAIEQLALVEEIGLGGVHVLRTLVGAHRAAAEAKHATPAVADREHDPRPEAVVLAAAAAALDQPDPAQLVDLEAGPLAGEQDLVPGARREADPEVAQGRLGEPATGQVLARFAALARLPEVAGVEGGGPFEQLLEPPLTPQPKQW